MREQRLQLLMGMRGVWVSQAAERGGCRVSFVSVETPSFSGGWLGPQCCAQPTEPGEGQETCFVHQGPDLICTGSREQCLPYPSGLRIPRHLCRCLDCHHSDFPPSSVLSTCDCSANITLAISNFVPWSPAKSYPSFLPLLLYGTFPEFFFPRLDP